MRDYGKETVEKLISEDFDRIKAIKEINKHFEEIGDDYRVDNDSIYPFLFGVAKSCMKMMYERLQEAEEKEKSELQETA